MLNEITEQAEAVVFFEGLKVVREMLFSEFEAVLDCYVPIPDFRQQDLNAVYVRIDSDFAIRSAVFFTIQFDAKGFADKQWNVPVQQLSETAAKGPDLGAGPIRLACHSQCNVAWHRDKLWDPDMAPGNNHFQNLRKAIKNNRLGLMFKPAETAASTELSSSATDTAREQQFRNHMASTLKEQRLRISTLNSQHKLQVKTLQLEHQERLQQYRQQHFEQVQGLNDSEQRNAQLKQTIDAQAQKIEGVREYFEHKLANAQTGEAAQLEALEANFELELEAKIEAACTELKDQLQMRELELLYRREQENSFQEEIRGLREEKQAIMANSGDQLLSRLSLSGVSFVTFLPGAGHITVPVDDMGKYIENPQSYAAEKSGVSLGQYQQWHKHHQLPQCQALAEGGSICGANIARVAAPRDYHAGENDRCEHHQADPIPALKRVRS